MDPLRGGHWSRRRALVLVPAMLVAIATGGWLARRPDTPAVQKCADVGFIDPTVGTMPAAHATPRAALDAWVAETGAPQPEWQQVEDPDTEDGSVWFEPPSDREQRYDIVHVTAVGDGWLATGGCAAT